MLFYMLLFLHLTRFLLAGQAFTPNEYCTSMSVHLDVPILSRLSEGA